MRRRLLLIVICCCALVPALESLAAEAADLEAQSIAMVNQERAAAGLPALASDGPALDVARRHSVRMSEEGRLFHNSNLPNEIDAWLKLGENVGRGPSVRDIHDAFMASPDHRHNILDPDFESIAVGIQFANDQIWLTQVFILREKAAAAPAPSAASVEPATPRPRARVAGVKVTRPAPAPPAQPPAPETVVEGVSFVEHQSQTAMLAGIEEVSEGEVLAIGPVDLSASARDELPAVAAAALVALMMAAHLFRLKLRQPQTD